MRGVLAATAASLLVLDVVGGASPDRGQQADSVAAELFAPGVVSTAGDELNAAFTPDGGELFWSINTAQGSGSGVIVRAQVHSGRVGAPEVASFSGQYSDYDPFVAPDGRRLYFISNRPKGAATWNPGDFDIYVVERSGVGWSAPRNLGAPVNSDSPEYYPSVASDGTLYFSTIRTGSHGFDIFRARPSGDGFAEPENLGDSISGTLNTAEIDNFVAPDQSFVVFASGRPGGLGSQDLYVSFSHAGQWTSARPLPKGINSPAREYCPIGSPDGRYLYFTSMRGFPMVPPSRRLELAEWRDSIAAIRNGNGNIYRAPLTAVTALAH